MAFSLQGDSDLTTDSSRNFEYEADAEPVVDKNVSANETKPNDPVASADFDAKIKDALIDGQIDCDDLLSNSGMSSNPGEFKFENSAVEIANSSSVHIGNSFHQKTDIKFDRATSVIVDRRQWNYINCSDTKKVPFQRSESQMVIVSKVQTFNQDRYRNRLAYFTPLPWCTWFSPHLDNLYTALQLVTTDRFDGRSGPTIISLEQIVQEKQSEFPLSNGARPCRVLIEGNPGYGKTTLTLKMASDWAAKKEYIDNFHLVFLIPLRDFQGDLQSYLFNEFFPQHESSQDRDDWWNYIKENHQSILFILDGLDELSPDHRAPIDMLLKGNIFDKVSVVVTSRSISSDDNILSYFNRRVEIRGFGNGQTEQFIQNYFQIKQKPNLGTELINLLDGPYSSSRHLASCPLTCLFLCVVFEDEGNENEEKGLKTNGVLHKMTQIYQGIVNWLVRRALNKKQISVVQDGSSTVSPVLFPTQHDYEKALSDFGLLCLQALARGGTQFTHEQLKELPNNSCELVLELGLMVRRNSPRNTTLYIPKNPSYQPIHKAFLEYLAAVYLSGSLEQRFVEHINFLQSPSISRESINLIFKFLAGLLQENAAVFFRLHHLSAFELPVITLFELLRESGATTENVRALSSILDNEIVVVRSNQIELDGWAGLLAEPDCPIRSIKFVWADAPFNSAALDRFFTAFQTNRSVICLVMSGACGLAPDENDVVAMGAFTVQALKKTQLRHFSLHLVGDTWAPKVVTAVNNMLNYRYVAFSLTSIKISVDVGTQQVVSLSQGLRQSNVKSLVLSKLSCEPEGYASIALLFKSLQHLSVSLNLLKALPPSRVDNRYEEGSPGDLQTFESYFKAAARQRAGINVLEPVGPRKSTDATTCSSGSVKRDDESAYNEANLLALILSVLESSNHNDFKLQDGLRLPGIMAPNALGFFKLNEPECQLGTHASGFHSLFIALQEPECQLSRLDLTGCCLEPMDLNCLGQATRRSHSLKSLRLAKLKKFEEVLPILINTNLTWLDVSSGYINIDKGCIIKLIYALSTASKLVSLSLAGWKFTIENNSVLRIVDRFMRSSQLEELNLTGCRFLMQMSLHSVPSAGTSCMSLISQIATNQNDEHTSRSNLSQMLSALRLKLPTSSRPTSSTGPVITSKFSEDCAEALGNESVFAKPEMDFHSESLNGKSQWPNLTKLSLTETVATFQELNKKDVETVAGPELFVLLDQLRNLTELSVSMKPKMPESATSTTCIPPLNDIQTKKFFRAIQRRLGRQLERLCMSFCSIAWQRPSQTACTLIRRLQKCEKLVELELNFVQFCAAAESRPATAPQKVNQQPHTTGQGDPIHWLLYAVVAGCPRLQELSLIGTTLTLTQAYNLGLQIRDKWKGVSLRIHIWRTSNDDHHTAEIISMNLLHELKNDSKFETDFIGGYRATVLIRRRKHLCSLVSKLNEIKIGIPKLLPLFCPSSSDLFSFRANGTNNIEELLENDNMEELCSTLPPGLRSLFGLTPFDYSIMLAHNWDSYKE